MRLRTYSYALDAKKFRTSLLCPDFATKVTGEGKRPITMIGRRPVAGARSGASGSYRAVETANQTAMPASTSTSSRRTTRRHADRRACRAGGSPATRSRDESRQVFGRALMPLTGDLILIERMNLCEGHPWD